MELYLYAEIHGDTLSVYEADNNDDTVPVELLATMTYRSHTVYSALRSAGFEIIGPWFDDDTHVIVRDLSATRRVARGIEHMDAHYPEWRGYIQVPVQIDREEMCVLGQVFGSYHGAPDGRETIGWAHNHGMMPYGDDVEALNLLWDREVSQ